MNDKKSDKTYDQKPREKLINEGSEKLRNAELLAILLGTGTTKENVFSLSERLIKNYDNFAFENIQSVEQIQKLWNTGLVQACRIFAFVELGKRLFAKKRKKILLQSPHAVGQYCREMSTLEQEQCRVLSLSTQNGIVAEEIVAIGTLNTAAIETRAIFRQAMIENAAGIILVHNHPSGNPMPSEDDMKMTENLKKIGKMLKIPMLDHLIIGESAYFSFESGSVRSFKRKT